MLKMHAPLTAPSTFDAVWSPNRGGGSMEKCGWRRAIVYYACLVAVNPTIPSSPLIGIPASSGRDAWRAYTGAPAESPQSGEAVGAPFLAADAVIHEEQPPGVIFLFQLLQLRVVGPQWARCQSRSKKLLSAT